MLVWQERRRQKLLQQTVILWASCCSFTVLGAGVVFQDHIRTRSQHSYSRTPAHHPTSLGPLLIKMIGAVDQRFDLISHILSTNVFFCFFFTFLPLFRKVVSSPADPYSVAIHPGVIKCSQSRWPPGKRCRRAVEEKRKPCHWDR